MSRKIWRYTMTRQEQMLWDNEEMKGWREALQGCVEDDAREKRCHKFIVYNRTAVVVAQGEVSRLPEPVVVS